MDDPTFDPAEMISSLLTKIDEGRAAYKNTQHIRDEFWKTCEARDAILRRRDDLCSEMHALDEAGKIQAQKEVERLNSEYQRLAADTQDKAEPFRQTTAFIGLFCKDLSLLLLSLPLTGEWPAYREEIKRLPVENEQSWIYPAVNSVLDLLKKRLREMLALVPLAARKQAKQIQPFPTPSGASWKDVTVTFTSEHRVDMSVFEIRQTRNYADLGFEDRRGGGKPDLAWGCLIQLAEGAGKFERPTSLERPGWLKLEKKVQTARARLRQVFGIAGDPLPFRKGAGYEAQFKIVLGPSFKH